MYTHVARVVRALKQKKNVVVNTVCAPAARSQVVVQVFLNGKL